MKTTLILFAVTTAAALADEVIPNAHGKERYEEMFASSPFVLATPPTEDKGPPPDSPLNNLFITSMSLGDDGVPRIYIKRTGEERGFKIIGEEKDQETGISITKVTWADNWKKATVTAKHGTETRELKFNETQPVVQPQPNMGPGGRRMMPGGNQPGGPGGGPVVTPPNTPGGPVPAPRAGMPQPNVPRPTTTQIPQVPRPGAGATLQRPPNGSQPTFTPNGGDQRSRVRGPINNGNGGGNGRGR